MRNHEHSLFIHKRESEDEDGKKQKKIDELTDKIKFVQKLNDKNKEQKEKEKKKQKELESTISDLEKKLSAMKQRESTLDIDQRRLKERMDKFA